MRKYTITYNKASSTWWGEFNERNAKGERIKFAICEWLGFDKSEPDWYYTAEVWVYNNKGECFGDYNPTVKPRPDGKRGLIVNPDWKLEATDENREKLIKEIERRAFAI